MAHGGEATESEAQFEELPASDQSAVVAFLKTLVMPLIENNPNPQQADSPVRFSRPCGSRSGGCASVPVSSSLENTARGQIVEQLPDGRQMLLHRRLRGAIAGCSMYASTVMASLSWSSSRRRSHQSKKNCFIVRA